MVVRRASQVRFPQTNSLRGSPLLSQLRDAQVELTMANEAVGSASVSVQLLEPVKNAKQQAEFLEFVKANLEVAFERVKPAYYDAGGNWKPTSKLPIATTKWAMLAVSFENPFLAVVHGAFRGKFVDNNVVGYKGFEARLRLTLGTSESESKPVNTLDLFAGPKRL